MASSHAATANRDNKMMRIAGGECIAHARAHDVIFAGYWPREADSSGEYDMGVGGISEVGREGCSRSYRRDSRAAIWVSHTETCLFVRASEAASLINASIGEGVNPFG